MHDKMDESEYPYFFVTTVFYNGMMTNKVYLSNADHECEDGDMDCQWHPGGASRGALSGCLLMGSLGIVQITI